jgi:hypothetical protein
MIQVSDRRAMHFDPIGSWSGPLITQSILGAARLSVVQFYDEFAAIPGKYAASVARRSVLSVRQ